MTAILYPVAANAAAALSAPLGRVAREQQAAALAGQGVVFATEPVGPAFATREAALDAFRGRLEDDRPGSAAQIVPEDRYCRLTEVVAAGRPPGPVQPVYRDGRRWPKPPEHGPRTAWRLMVCYWRIATADRPIEAPQARQARRAKQPLDPETLRAIAGQPLRPVEPQQPLDIGLFEIRPPDAPHIVMPDE